LNEAEYARLEALGGNEITKYRYLYNVHGFQFGIDVFAGRHEGLILAEIEAESEQELEQIAAPGFSVCEVTEDAFFTGASLSIPTALDVRNKLRELAG
jgi:adenylate cyclase